jgi:hypothetical protein
MVVTKIGQRHAGEAAYLRGADDDPQVQRETYEK